MKKVMIQLLAIIICLQFLGLSIILNKERKFKNNYHIIEDEFIKTWSTLKHFSDLDSLRISYTNFSMNPLSLLRNEVGKEATFLEFNESNKLYIWYGHSVCSSCIESLMYVLLELQIDFENVVILTNYDNWEQISVFKLKTRNRIPVYNLSGSSILPFENAEQPVFFQLNESLRIINPHIYIQDNPDLSTYYVESIFSGI